ncbi:MAG: hypothetical protein MUC37_11125 [Hyphomicrobium sp.]|jgi:hypothetical protein|nr:hypothetical protein [Hyphomicrobium sp.]
MTGCIGVRRFLAGLVGMLPALAFGIGADAAPPDSGACTSIKGFALLATPSQPWKGAPLRVLAVSETAVDAELVLRGPDGSLAARAPGRRGGPPYFWLAEVPAPASGEWTASLRLASEQSGCKALTTDVTVRKSSAAGPGTSPKSVWPVRAKWNRETEDLYSAWIEALFDAPLDASPSWPALHEVLRDPARNLLHNHLGLKEDETGLVIKPDCADLPYFLRAYFAFKLGLPFGYSKCTRGGKGKPPQCLSWWNIENQEPPPEAQEPKPQQTGLFDGLFGGAAPAEKPKPRPKGPVVAFGEYLSETIANTVHSGTGRPPATSDNSDYYSVPLTEAVLRPGTVYHDPYGHILVVVRRVPQTPETAGMIFAVDGQPDGTVARKRFWRGNFLFAQNAALGSPGFKRFRPIVRGKTGLRRLTNAEIAGNPDYGDFSLEQSELSVEGFYDRMDDVMSPSPLDPERAMMAAIDALDEQVRARVTSVENGRKYHQKGGGEVTMPDGPAIFETTGAWEDFATPSRDLRLLIAIDVVRGFPERVARRPERYAMPAQKTPADVKSDLEQKLAAELASRKFAYTRSDGSEWTLALADVAGRSADLEIAYNVNDCAELRWGAPAGSDEIKTCNRRAPDAQRQKMASTYRAWFSERRRPPRG